MAPSRTSFAKVTPLIHAPIIGNLDTPHTPYPYTHLLSNGAYTVMITNSGGGYTRFKDIDITRWRADATCDAWGSFCYIKDLEKNLITSTTFHPINTLAQTYNVNFVADKAEFKKRDFGIEIATEIVVSPEDNVEIRIVTLGNLSLRRRYLELTSYMELALAPHAADTAHPVFNKMFIETEAFRSLKDSLVFGGPGLQRGFSMPCMLSSVKRLKRMASSMKPTVQTLLAETIPLLIRLLLNLS